jgi:MOSC domain-containing protein YiiM
MTRRLIMTRSLRLHEQTGSSKMRKSCVVAVCSSSSRSIAKTPKTSINLIAGLGVEGDVHLGRTTQHLYLAKRHPSRANLTQVHLLHAELHDLLNEAGFKISPGLMGENITTSGIELMSLPSGTRLNLGKAAIIQVTGFRQPCSKLNRLRPGLMKASFMRDQCNGLVPNAGIMGIVVRGGSVSPGDAIEINLPEEPHLPLQAV